MGDGEDVVIADVGAAGLGGKENKVTIIMTSSVIMPLTHVLTRNNMI